LGTEDRQLVLISQRSALDAKSRSGRNWSIYIQYVSLLYCDRVCYVDWYIIINFSEEHPAPIYPEDGDRMFLRKVSNDPPDLMVITQITMESSTAMKTLHLVWSVYSYCKRRDAIPDQVAKLGA
jgi:hypothetical protein